MTKQMEYTIHAGNRAKCFYVRREGALTCDGFDMSHGDKMDKNTRIWRIAGVKEIEIPELKHGVVKKSARNVTFYPEDIDYTVKCRYDGSRLSCSEERN